MAACASTPRTSKQLFPIVPVGTPGEFIYEPVKIGARDGHIYAEVSPDIYKLVPDMRGEAERLVAELGWQNYIDHQALARAVDTQSGVPTDITLGGKSLRQAQPGRPEML